MSWNYAEFEVSYRSLADEIKIGDYFLRVLLEEDQLSTENEDLDLESIINRRPCHRDVMTKAERQRDAHQGAAKNRQRSAASGNQGEPASTESPVNARAISLLRSTRFAQSPQFVPASRR